MTARVAVFRAIGRCCGSDNRGQPGSELARAAMRGMTDPGDAERVLGDTADRNDLTPRGEELEERARRLDLVGPWPAIGLGLAPPVRVRRHDVPEEHVLIETELVEHTVNDRRGCLGRALPRQLALRGERDSADPRAAIAGRLADEQELGAGALREVVRQSPPT